MEPNHLQAGLFCQPADLVPPRGRDLPDVRRDREGRNFNPRVAAIASKGECPLERPIEERLVANGELHSPGKKRVDKASRAGKTTPTIAASWETKSTAVARGHED